MSQALAGRVVVVTGAGRGLGREHALCLARHGAAVVANDLPTAEGNAADGVVAEIAAMGGKAVADGHSVTGWDSAGQMIQTALDTFGRLDGLVCNAGILRDKMLVNMAESDWDDVIKVHQYGTFFALRHAAAHWRERSKAGDDVNAGVVLTTAISGLHSNVGQVNYGAAKAAIALMAVSAAREVERYGVRVNAISPLARTRLTQDAPRFAHVDDGFDEMDPAHVSPLVAWLLSPQCTATAQVYGVFGREIHRYEMWRPQEAAISEEDWTLESVGSALDGWPVAYAPGRIPGLPAKSAAS
jgi:NAD(P)-dependent dehydrogenase (short-subunit alcohol dehydrogenase family)